MHSVSRSYGRTIWRDEKKGLLTAFLNTTHCIDECQCVYFYSKMNDPQGGNQENVGMTIYQH